jgi:hypothetical protein
MYYSTQLSKIRIVTSVHHLLDCLDSNYDLWLMGIPADDYNNELRNNGTHRVPSVDEQWMKGCLFVRFGTS